MPPECSKAGRSAFRIRVVPDLAGVPGASLRSVPRELTRAHERNVTLPAGHLLNRKVRIPGDFPQVAFRVGKVAGVASPEGVLGRLDQGGARVHGNVQ